MSSHGERPTSQPAWERSQPLNPVDPALIGSSDPGEEVVEPLDGVDALVQGDMAQSSAAQDQIRASRPAGAGFDVGAPNDDLQQDEGAPEQEQTAAAPNSGAALPAVLSSNRAVELQRRAQGTSERGLRLRLGWTYKDKPSAPRPPKPENDPAFREAAFYAQNPLAAAQAEIIDPQVTAQIIQAEADQITHVWRAAKTASLTASIVSLVSGFACLLAPSIFVRLAGFAALSVAVTVAITAVARTGKYPKLLVTNPIAFFVGSLVTGGAVAFSGFPFSPLSFVAGAAVAGAFGWIASHCQGEVQVVNEVAQRRIAEGHYRQREVFERVQSKGQDAKRRLQQAQANFKEELERWEQTKTWHPVRLRMGGSRLDVVGGTPMGWSAMLLTTCGDILQAGGQVTVVDLSELAVAQELVDLSLAFSLDADVVNLPNDLPRVDLGETLDRAALIDILTNVVHDADSNARREEWAANAAIIERIVDVLGDRANPARVIAGLRVILREEAPPMDDHGLLTFDEYEELSALYGEKVRAAGVDQKCYNLLNQLQGLSKLGLEAQAAKSTALRVISLDPTGTDLGNAVLGDFVTHACIRQLRTSGFDHGFESTIVIVGAERMNTRNLDQIARYADKQGVGLVLMFQKLTEEVNGFVGSGDASVAFMRMGNAKEAKFASEQIGMAPRFVMSQITENVSSSVTDTIGSSYSMTDGTSSNWSDGTSDNFSTSDSNNYSGDGMMKKKGSGSGDSTSDSFGTSKNFSRGLSVSSQWGDNTSRAVGDTTGESRTLQRSKENLVEMHELQTLPQTAFIFVDMNSGGGEPRIMLGDANPGITLLNEVAEYELEEAKVEEFEDDSMPLALPNADEHKYKYAEAFVVRDPVVRNGNIRDARPAAQSPLPTGQPPRRPGQ